MSLRTTAATLCLVALAGAAACSEDEGATDPSPTTADSPAATTTDTTTTTNDPGTAWTGDGEGGAVYTEAVGLAAAWRGTPAATAGADGPTCPPWVRAGREPGRGD